ncbi:hypothetical protein EXU30_18745 [Shewanella maritima]|uniref:Uncharacterized protein n=1 Tax=Shewanella maritima TaxID=2520507 RepID=A0A411PN76_9GAMM|nr:hypothetical protein [Shewanella maritima]QBF84979.1 hypothetical protein EXU30_18745 [Shewanella maritima]
MSIHPIDVPFNKRHLCWFCEEPSNQTFEYLRLPHTPHPSLAIPACNECKQLAKANMLTSIWDCRAAVKDQLIIKYQKHLAIGHNWTEQELKESEFSCKVFEGFKNSAWMMYNIAKDRVNAKGWQISIDEQPISEEHDYSALQAFSFDDIEFSSITQAISHYSKTLGVSSEFVTQLVSVLGKQQFAKALTLARLNIGVTKGRQRQIIQDVMHEKDALS